MNKKATSQVSIPEQDNSTQEATQQLGVPRDPFLQAVYERVERMAHEQNLRIDSLFFEDFSEPGKMHPIEHYPSPLSKMLASKDLDLLFVAGSGNDSIRWDDGFMDMGTNRACWIDESRFLSFISCTDLDGVEFENTKGLIVYPASEGRSIWLLACEGYEDLSEEEEYALAFPLVGELSMGENLKNFCPELNCWTSPDPSTAEGQRAADALADIVWNRPVLEGLTTHISTGAFVGDKTRKRFMDFDPFCLDWETVQDYAVSEEELTELMALPRFERMNKRDEIVKRLEEGRKTKAAQEAKRRKH